MYHFLFFLIIMLTLFIDTFLLSLFLAEYP